MNAHLLTNTCDVSRQAVDVSSLIRACTLMVVDVVPLSFTYKPKVFANVVVPRVLS